MAESRYGSAWSHDETVLALGLYFQIPFGKINKSAPEVVKLASEMNRSPSSLSMKMGNIGRFDPTLAARGITGLPNGSKTEKIVWDEYDGRREDLAIDYSRIRQSLTGKLPVESDDVIKTPPGLDREHLTRYRVNQSFFRKSVLTAYNNTCCISGINDSRLLIASHIMPWARCTEGHDRTCTSNGLCLNTLYDSAFDKGLMTLDEELRVVYSSDLIQSVSKAAYQEYFGRYEGRRIQMPDRGAPDERFLSYHRQFVFHN